MSLTSHLSHLIGLDQALEEIVSHLKDFEAAVNAKFERLEAAHAGLAADVAFLVEEAKKIPTDTLDPEDAATVERVKARLDGLVAEFETLDALTVPVVAPPVPGPAPTDEDHG